MFRRIGGVMKAEREGILEGYAVVFGDYSDVYNEMILPGSFSDSLRDDDQVCLWGHDARVVLGRKSNGTLSLREDDRGIYFECQIDKENPEAFAKWRSVNRGDVKQCSFGFYPKDVLREEGINKVKKGTLFEVSPVVFPAYKETTVTARGIALIRSIEQAMLEEDEETLALLQRAAAGHLAEPEPEILERTIAANQLDEEGMKKLEQLRTKYELRKVE